MSNSDELDKILKEIKNKQDSTSTDDYQNVNNSFDKTPIETAKDDNDTKGEEINMPEPPLPAQNQPETPKNDVYEDVYSSFQSTRKDEDTKNDEYKDFLSGVAPADEYPEENMKSKGNKKPLIIALVIIIIIALGAGIYFGFLNNKKSTTTQTTQQASTTVATTQAAVATVNPFTGSSNYNQSAVGKRPVALVVENSYDARPQWGISSKQSPDIILEGEVEGGESRMLWFYADYTALPSKIGPMRSARPPYIKFSELFDAIFIHWGQSHSKGSYIGAKTVFKKDNVDHINEMTYSGSVKLYARDTTRNVATEHTGILYGDKVAAAIKELKFRTAVNESKFTTFSFNDEATAVGTSTCNKLSLTFSSRSNTRDWKYSTSDKLYHSTDYKTDVTRKNLIVLFDKTSYVQKSNYKGSGSSETYCNYALAGGKGVLASQGTYTNITWSVESGKLVLKDTSGQTIKLNVGKSWIGYASSNNGGKVVES